MGRTAVISCVFCGEKDMEEGLIVLGKLVCTSCIDRLKKAFLSTPAYISPTSFGILGTASGFPPPPPINPGPIPPVNPNTGRRTAPSPVVGSQMGAVDRAHLKLEEHAPLPEGVGS